MKSILKIFSICIVLLQCINVKAQSGLNCSSAISVNSYSTCNYQNYSTTGSEMWFKFVAQSKDVNISVVTSKYGIDIAHIHNIALYSGNCSSLNFITDDELPFEFNAKELNIDMNASGLIVGNTYYIKLNRKALHDDCDKSNCKLSGSTSVAYFSMCIENIDVIVPPDFGIEKPNVNHSYVQNRGQLVDASGNLVPHIKMYSKSSNPQVYIGDNFTSFVVSKVDTIPTTKDTMQRIDMTLVGANTANKVFKTEQSPGITNYYLPHIPNGITNNKSFYRSVINEIYPKIDLQHYSNSDGLKFYFVVRPGGDANLIKMKFDGATATATTATGGLSIKTFLGDIVFEKAHVYRINPANNIVPMPTSGNFIKTGDNEYQIDVQNYPPNMPVIIQIDRGHTAQKTTTTNNPVWCTDYGAPDYDQVYQIDSDNSGNLYATGYAVDHTFPYTTGIFNSTNGGMPEAYLLKFAPFGTPIYRILYGGSGIDNGFRVKADNVTNSVYMVGYTGYSSSSPYNTDFPLQNAGGSSYFHTSASGSNVPYYGFITKFDMNSGSRSWATLFGDDYGSGETQILAIDVAPNGDLFIGGTASKNTNFPIVTPTATCTVYSQNTTGVQTGFLAKFDTQNQLLWSTTFGNTNTVIRDIKVNSQSELFITGSTTSTNVASFPLKKEFTNDVMNSYAGGTSDGFVSKFSNCLELKWSTLFGGAGNDISYAIEISEGTAVPAKTQSNTVTYTYISGVTSSSATSFPLLSNGNTNSINDTVLNGQDGFIAGFNGANELYWSTYVGGTNSDALYDMEFGKNGTLFLTGASKSTDFLLVPYANAYNQTQLENTAGGNDYDAVIIALAGKSMFSKLWSTYFGGNTSISGYRSDDYGYGITTTNNYLYIGGLTWSYNNFPWNVNSAAYPNAYYQPNLGGGFSQDGFLAQIDLTPTALSVDEIKQLEDLGFVIYPNPSNGNVYIMLDEKKLKTDKVNVQVYDIEGREIMTKPYNSSNEPFYLNLSPLSSGMYFIKLIGENLNTSQKIIINH